MDLFSESRNLSGLEMLRKMIADGRGPPIASSASSTADTFLAARAADNSTAVLKLHCDLAKAYPRAVCSMSRE